MTDAKFLAWLSGAAGLARRVALVEVQVSAAKLAPTLTSWFVVRIEPQRSAAN